MPTRRALTRSTAFAALALLAACSHPTTPAAVATAPPPTGMDADPTAVATGPAPGVVPPELVADAAVGEFTDHDPDPAHWWSQLSLRMATSAQAQAYAGTDPANVPGTTVLGAGVIEPSPSPALATVDVPTDAGTYRVLLSVSEAGTWRVERFGLPAGQH